jgi:pantoate--beta-alanine ligase
VRVVRSAAQLSAAIPEGRRAVVMTMGALHAGHLSLVRRATEVADRVVVTIFVNPLQFTDPRDLERYPRTLEADCALLATAPVEVVYAPEIEDVYPGGEPVVTVSAGRVGEVFEGAHRPGHFDGVLTVVLKFFHIVRPDVAIFGQKDAQQLIAIRAMVRDLNLPIEIIAAPTVRDPDGLAISSRNRFLSPRERQQALALSTALMACSARAEQGDSVDGILAAGYSILASAEGVVLDYLSVLDPRSAEAVTSDYRGDVVIAVAARVGGTRLIDNVPAVMGGGG